MLAAAGCARSIRARLSWDSRPFVRRLLWLLSAWLVLQSATARVGEEVERAVLWFGVDGWSCLGDSCQDLRTEQRWLVGQDDGESTWCVHVVWDSVCLLCICLTACIHPSRYFSASEAILQQLWCTSAVSFRHWHPEFSHAEGKPPASRVWDVVLSAEFKDVGPVSLGSPAAPSAEAQPRQCSTLDHSVNGWRGVRGRRARRCSSARPLGARHGLALPAGCAGRAGRPALAAHRDGARRALRGGGARGARCRDAAHPRQLLPWRRGLLPFPRGAASGPTHPSFQLHVSVVGRAPPSLSSTNASLALSRGCVCRRSPSSRGCGCARRETARRSTGAARRGAAAAAARRRRGRLDT